jgi:hypothetical protein
LPQVGGAPAGIDLPYDRDMRLDRIRKALLELDHDELEILRSSVGPTEVRVLAREWSQALDRATKDAYLALLMDQKVETYPELAPMMIDGLASSTFEIRAYAACSILGDFEIFTQILEGVWPAERLAAALAKLTN